MGLLPWKKTCTSVLQKRGPDSGYSEVSGVQGEQALQAVIKHQSKLLKRQETELRQIKDNLSAATVLLLYNTHTVYSALLKSLRSAIDSEVKQIPQRPALPPQELRNRPQPKTWNSAAVIPHDVLSVSSAGGRDCAFQAHALDLDIIVHEMTQMEAQNCKPMSKYESTINGDNFTVYAPSVASSTALSLTASQISSQDQNGETPQNSASDSGHEL
ncbi:hypothetical protein MMC29_004716 [Sticta canariensis]|nr:hypothetical protein [Sticta canariensis]